MIERRRPRSGHCCCRAYIAVGLVRAVRIDPLEAACIRDFGPYDGPWAAEVSVPRHSADISSNPSRAPCRLKERVGVRSSRDAAQSV